MFSSTKTPSPKSKPLPTIQNFRASFRSEERSRIVLKKIKIIANPNLRLSWTSKLMTWKSILEDQKDYRERITKIELYNQKLMNGRRKKQSPHRHTNSP